eukprot:2688779-Rhodomonas_salina.1
MGLGTKRRRMLLKGARSPAGVFEYHAAERATGGCCLTLTPKLNCIRPHSRYWLYLNSAFFYLISPRGSTGAANRRKSLAVLPLSLDTIPIVALSSYAMSGTHRLLLLLLLFLPAISSCATSDTDAGSAATRKDPYWAERVLSDGGRGVLHSHPGRP